MRIRWTRQAQRELAALSARTRDMIIDTVELLDAFPLLGAAMDGPYRAYRQILAGRYRVIHRVAGREVRIAYIRHGARQLTLRLVRDDE